MDDHGLFIWNVICHLVASMSGVASFGMAIYENVRQKKIESRVFFAIGVFCLVIAFDQAWQDEHRNSEVLVGQKATISSEAAFWKAQSYAKDGSLRSRDQLLSQNYTALIGEQSTANGSQSALAKLSSKILEIGRPVQLRWVIHPLSVSPGESSIKIKYFIAIPNKEVNPAYMEVSCDQDIVAGQGVIIGAKQPLMGIGPVVQSRQFSLTFTAPPWSPLSPALINVQYKGTEPNCSVGVS